MVCPTVKAARAAASALVLLLLVCVPPEAGLYTSKDDVELLTAKNFDGAQTGWRSAPKR